MTVYLVGAGPGDPGLITVRGLTLIKRADVILYDRLSSPKLLDHASAACIKEYVGKSPDNHAKTQDEINSLLVTYGKSHKTVVRLKGGDPFVFGRGGEEALALSSEGISYEIVPGISSSIAGPAYAGIPVTHRGINTAVTILTGHRWDASRIRDTYAGLSGTLVILMGASSFPEISADLISMGYAPDTPVAAVHNATLPSQGVYRGTLSDLAHESIPSPSVFVIGDVAALHDTLAWHAPRLMALKGKRVLIMRSPRQHEETAKMLHEYGAEAINGGFFSIMPFNWDVEVAKKADLMIVTSANTVPVLDSQGALFPDKAYVAIGPKSKEALERHGIQADMPDTYTSEGLGAYICTKYPPYSKIVGLRSINATKTLQSILTNFEYIEMPVYDIAYNDVDEGAVAKSDVIFFTSTAMVNAIADIVPNTALRVSIGPVTSQALMLKGIPPHAQASQSTLDSMVEATLDYLH